MSKDLGRRLIGMGIGEAEVMAVSLGGAKRSMIGYRVAEGFRGVSVKLLTAPDENLKLSHSGVERVAAFGLSLAPADESGWNVCRYATAGCRAACLATSGNGRYGGTQRGRVWKTKWLGERPLEFLRVLVAEIDAIRVGAWSEAGWTVSFRFNVLSDLPWEVIAPWLVERIRDRGIRLYDYSAYPSSRRDRGVASGLGYYLVDSVKEKHSAAQIMAMDRPVVVFDVRRGAPLPATYLGRPVIDADVSDARFLDEEGTVRGLRYKNVSSTDRAAAIASGFVKVAS